MTIAHIFNGELGFDVRAKLNDVIDIANAAGGGGGSMAIGGAITSATAGSVLFAGPAGVLAQDNANFYWDATHHSLNISGVPALFKIPHGFGDNWFVGGAGNFTLSGFSNVEIGAGAATLLTAGSANVVIGVGAYASATSGSQNTALGYLAGSNLTSGSNNTLLGGWSGPSGALSNAIALSDGSGNLHLDYNFTSSGIWTFAAGESLALQGGTSGTVKINTKAIAGAWTLTLPDTAGTSGYVLSTNGAGITSWVAGGGGGSMAIGGAITSATAGSVLYAGTGGILAQQNSTFYWDDTNEFLKLGNASTKAGIYLNNLPAIVEVTTAGGNNWWEGGAGNFTLTGYANFGTGDGALASITSGTYNFAIGRAACGFLTSGYMNLGIGDTALWQLTTGARNVGIGQLAMYNNNTGNDNVAVGYHALQNFLASGFTAIGSESYSNLTGGFSGVAIGFTCAPSITTSNFDTFIGNSTAAQLTGTTQRNVFVGSGAGYYYTGANNCTILGSWNGNSSGGTINDIIVISAGLNEKLDYSYTRSGMWTLAQTVLFSSSQALSNAAAGNTATMTNAPVSGNPTKWVTINDNGTVRYIPAW